MYEMCENALQIAKPPARVKNSSGHDMAVRGQLDAYEKECS